MATTRAANKSSTATVTAFAHAPSSFTLYWLAISLPLVVWDSGYVFMRPRSMPGGDLHWPLWVPYALYGEIDHVYGWKAFNAGSGFTSGQGFLNVLETLLYIYYVAVYFQNAIPVGGAKVVVGRKAAISVLVAFSAAVMTLSKTILYWLCEYYSGFDNIGHNSLLDLIFLWIIPNGAWLVGPTVMIYELGNELVNGLVAGPGVKRD
ncbi:hypothetical protein EKO27_g626 [Xylaria grammica]|uniref:EXPERA domain-containing protein n=1 Tax=Xylaria grammica TaxID=363999 RepID=A0A439DJD6_9PEZI|nr:hypothetical protein EKO27_g626 [Xylaria grammica]